MPYSPLTHDSVFLHVFGEEEGLPLLESLINANFEAVGLPLVHTLQLQPRELSPVHAGEKLAIVDILAHDETGRTVNVEVQTTRKPAYFERALFYWARLFARQLPEGENYTSLKPVISLNFLEYEITKKGQWLHHFRLPHTSHLELTWGHTLNRVALTVPWAFRAISTGPRLLREVIPPGVGVRPPAKTSRG